MQNNFIDFISGDEPAITGSNVTVAYILERLDSGDSIEKILCEDHLTREQVHAALSYAEMILPQRKVNQTPYPVLNNATSEDDLDYSMLIENAGYFSPVSCSLHLVYAFRKRGTRSQI